MLNIVPSTFMDPRRIAAIILLPQMVIVILIVLALLRGQSSGQVRASSAFATPSPE
jgi:hypothetical protein